MTIDEEKIKLLRGERPSYDERFDERNFKSKYPDDLVKGIVEIIKNGVDAYINHKGEASCHGEKISISLEQLHTKNPVVKIVNFAKGMDLQKFQRALKIGADTSGEQEAVTGAHGYGMKEASWAFKFAKIVSVTGGKYTVRIFYWENGKPRYAWDKDEAGDDIVDRVITSKIRSETNIMDEGTYFEAVVPDEISFFRPDNLRTRLSENILLRTINQSDKFKIVLNYKDGRSGEALTLPVKYDPPEVLQLREDRREAEIGEFSFEYPGYGIINCAYQIYLAARELPYSGESREAGLLVCSGPFTVLDCTLFDHGDRIAKRFFGKALLTGKMKAISKNEKIVDDKREAGLIKKTPLYENLHNYFHPLLSKLIDRERKRLSKNTEDVDETVVENKVELLRAFNRIDREETEESTDINGELKFSPGPTGIRFCVQDYLRLTECQERKVHLVVDPKLIPVGSEIQITVNKDGLRADPLRFTITKDHIDKEEIFKRKIFFRSDVIDTFFVTAHVLGMLNKAEMNVDVEKDPRLHITSPLQFLPDKDIIVVGKSKSFSLVFDKAKIDMHKAIDFRMDGKLFLMNKKVALNDAKNVSGYVYELLVPIHCLGKVNQKGVIEAEVENNKARLQITIVDSKDKHIRGDFEGIKDDPTEDPEELGFYEGKIIYICINHPILRHYRRNKETDENTMYRVLYSDIIIREFCKHLARKKNKLFENTTAEAYRVKFNRDYETLYKKHAMRLHKLCINPENLEKLKVH